MESQSSRSDIGLVSLEWLQSNDSFNFDTFGDIDALIVELPDFATTLSMPSEFSTTPTSTHPSTRFGAMAPRSSMFAMPDNDELQWLQDKNKKKSMKKSTNAWVNHLQRWQEHKGITRTLPDLNKRQLDKTLQQFYPEVRKEEYEPDSLRVMLGSLDCHFRENGAPYSLLNDKAFVHSRQVLNGKGHQTL